MNSEPTEFEKKIASILLNGDKYAKMEVISMLMIYEKLILLEGLKRKWGSDYNNIVEIC
jgi:hypothetical protein